jgi:hypothetical protein
MQGQPVPASLASVIEPLREAHEYQRLQHARQRGVYNLLTGMPGFFWIGLAMSSSLVAQAIGLPYNHPAILIATAVGWILFFLSCFTPQLLLPLVRRHRPDWTSPLLESSLLKQALEKLFWWQFPFWMVGYFVPVLLILPAFFLGHFSEVLTFGRAFLVSLHVTATAALAWRASRSNDRSLAMVFLLVLPLGALPLFVGVSQFPDPLSLALLAVALVIPPMVVGLLRLLAPWRWLIR